MLDLNWAGKNWSLVITIATIAYPILYCGIPKPRLIMRRFTLIVVYLIFLGVLLEVGVGRIGYRITQGVAFSYQELKTERRDLVAKFVGGDRVAVDLNQKESGKRPGYSTEIIHPYLGYVVDFHDDQCPLIGFCDDRMRGYAGALSDKGFFEASPDRAVVAIIGGSFAYGVGNSASEGKLEKALSTISEFKDKEIVVYTLALGGYKQPQQLFAIQYYLSMGAHFDMIINIDGFNEMVLPQMENIPFGTNPYFPRLWHQRVFRGVENRTAKVLQGRIAYIDEQRAILANQTNESFLSRSALKNLFWRFKDSDYQQKKSQTEMEYLVSAKSKPKFKSSLLTAGTTFSVSDETPGLKRLAQFWRRSSELLHNTAKGSGIRYYHFLQPNQYVENSKPMAAEERKIALYEGRELVHPYAEAARKGYPLLIAEGAKLSASEVAFHDLTPIFKDNTELLYYDACCHLNGRGYDYVIDEMVSYINNSTAGSGVVITPDKTLAARDEVFSPRVGIKAN